MKIEMNDNMVFVSLTEYDELRKIRNNTKKIIEEELAIKDKNYNDLKLKFDNFKSKHKDFVENSKKDKVVLVETSIKKAYYWGYEDDLNYQKVVEYLIDEKEVDLYLKKYIEENYFKNMSIFDFMKLRKELRSK